MAQKTLFQDISWNIHTSDICHYIENDKVEYTADELQQIKISSIYPIYIMLPYMRCIRDNVFCELHDIIKVNPDKYGNVTFLEISNKIKDYYHKVLSKQDLETAGLFVDDTHQEDFIMCSLYQGIRIQRYEAMYHSLYFEGLQQVEYNVYKLCYGT